MLYNIIDVSHNDLYADFDHVSTYAWLRGNGATISFATDAAVGSIILGALPEKPSTTDLATVRWSTVSLPASFL